MNLIRRLWKCAPMQYLCLGISACLCAITFVIFVFPNNFAPSGINGIATMVQYKLGFQVAYMSIIVNLPMLVAAYFVLDRRFALRTSFYVLIFAATLFVADRMDLSDVVYLAEDKGEALMAAIAGGIINGALYAFAVRVDSSTGGTDIVAAFINHRFPEFDTVWIIFVLNVVVAGISFFVYGMEYTPVILCAVFSFTAGRIGDSLLKGTKMAAKFEVVTTQPEELAAELMVKMYRGCTVVPAKGMYSGIERSILICVVNKRQIVEFERIVRKYEGSFAYVSTVNGTVGLFRRGK